MEIKRKLLEDILKDIIELYNNAVTPYRKTTKRGQQLAQEYLDRIVEIKRLLAEGEDVKKIKPCDCEDKFSASKLSEQGVGYNDFFLHLMSNSVVLRVGPCTVKIPQEIFKRFSEWYLKDQKKEG